MTAKYDPMDEVRRLRIVVKKNQDRLEAAAELAKALTALVEECKTNLDFAVNPYNTEADALSAAGAALAEWEAVK